MVKPIRRGADDLTHSMTLSFHNIDEELRRTSKTDRPIKTFGEILYLFQPECEESPSQFKL